MASNRIGYIQNTTSAQKGGSMGVVSATSIGIGGMIGAGIFSILGVVGQLAGSAAWLSFLGAGTVAMLCGHSFAKLGATFPSSGGPVKFLIRGFGCNVLSGTLNIILWFGYILAMALYASAFASYAVALWRGNGEADTGSALLHPILAASIVLVFLGLNLAGSAVVGRAEGVIVGAKVAILFAFVAVTLPKADPDLLSMSNWEPAHAIAFTFGTTFLAFEGFGLITNAAADMKNPRVTLPRAIYTSIGLTILIYVLVAIATLGSLPINQIVEKKEYALAAAAEPSFGQAGFVAIGIAALFSTASAINATLFGGANVGFNIAHERQLPKLLDRELWQGARVGLLVTAGLVAALAALVPLAAIANAGSAAFLIVYGAVAAAHLRLRHETGASAKVIWATIVSCALTLVLLMVYLARSDLTSLIGFVGLLALGWLTEYLYMRRRGRSEEPAEVR